MGKKQITLQKDVVTTFYKLVIDGKQTDYVADIEVALDENGNLREGYKVPWAISIVKAPLYRFRNVCKGVADTVEEAHERVIGMVLKL